MRRFLGLIPLAILVVVGAFALLPTPSAPTDWEPIAKHDGPRAPARPLRAEGLPRLGGTAYVERTLDSPSQRAPSAPGTKPALLAAARTALERLHRLLKRRQATNEEILAALEEVWLWYRQPREAGPVTLHAMPEPGHPDAHTVAEANLGMLMAPEDRDALTPEDLHFWREVDVFRRHARLAFLKAFGLTLLDGPVEVGGEPYNRRDDVNIRAAEILGETGARDVARRVQAVLERTITKRRTAPPMALWSASFDALGHLNDPRSFEWITHDFVRTRKSRLSDLDAMVAAHEALLLFRDVPAKDRFRLVKALVKTYVGVESVACRGSSREAEMLWKRVGPGVLGVLQHYTDGARDEQGRKIRTMAGFQYWWRSHKNRRRPPWSE